MAKYSFMLSSTPLQTGFRQFNFSRALCEAFLKENLVKENPFVKKYADKIATARRTAIKREVTETDENTHINLSCGKAKHCDKSVGNSIATSSFLSKNLGSLMNVEFLKDKSAKEITMIWNQYHASKDCIYAVVPKEAYCKMHSKAQEFPTFLHPVPKEGGYEFMLSHFIGNCCHFTSLLNYQIHAENAPLSLMITYYTDLCEEKGIVLMRGVHNEKLIDILAAQFLANQLQLYYGKNDPKKHHLLSTFTLEPQKFNYSDLIHELERSV